MNALLVDDQPQILSSLIHRINWNELDISSVQAATSALEAKQIISGGRIDILISDIEMPVEDGLSLLAWIREHHYDVECIFLTSHMDFFFAQQALGLGAVSYVLQPARDEEILQAIDRARIRVYRKQKAQEALNYNRFTSSAQNSVIQKFFESWPAPEEFAADPDLTDVQWDTLSEFGASRTEQGTLTLAVSFVARWTSLPQRSVEYLPRYKAELKQVLSYLDLVSISYCTEQNLLVSVIFGELTDALKKHMNIFRDSFSRSLNCRLRTCLCAAPVTDLKPAVNMLSEAVLAPADGSGQEASVSILEYAAESRTEPEAVPDSYSGFLKQIQTYIRENPEQPMTRTQIAEHIHLSPDYVSYIVRKCTGSTLKDLVIREKMEHARHLLEHTDMPIGDISQAVGFNSFAYFSKVYKDTYHVTPSQARREK